MTNGHYRIPVSVPGIDQIKRRLEKFSMTFPWAIISITDSRGNGLYGIQWWLNEIKKSA
jgi:hypothetical protein